MAFFSIPGVRISGLSACVPCREYDNNNYSWISKKERDLLIKTTGVERRRVSEPGTATSDLCVLAAEKLLEGLSWKKEDIQLLIFVSQARDFLLPATACIIQDRLCLSKSCIAFDMNMGCSGYVYGLASITSFMAVAKLKKALLLAGDITSLNSSYRDKTTFPLFGDAGTATALELDENAGEMYFNLQTDGSGHKAIIIPDGGLRNIITKESLEYEKIDKGIIRKRIQLSLDGIEVFNFSLREVAPNVNELLSHFSKNIADIDYFIFHQANLLMNETIRKKLRVPIEKFPYTLSKFGNTSSASIPLTIASEIRNLVRNEKLILMLSGFGVGLSWGSVLLETDKIFCPEVIEYNIQKK
jgi:3-oxoacyl-[acyl-carrier-protein] synthase III